MRLKLLLQNLLRRAKLPTDMEWRYNRNATLRDLHEMEERITKLMATQQDTINAISAELTAVKTVVDQTAANMVTIKTGIDSLKSNVVDLQKQIADLKAGNPALDLTGLQAAADAVQADTNSVETAAADAVTDLNPPPPATPTV